VSFAAITICVASQQCLLLLLFISLSTQSGNFWIHSRMCTTVMNTLLTIGHLLGRGLNSILKSLAGGVLHFRIQD
jgi:hypothetical protein